MHIAMQDAPRSLHGLWFLDRHPHVGRNGKAFIKVEE
jgi:hypothetical protein